MANSRILTNIDKIETGQPHSAGVMRTIFEDLNDMIYVSDTVPPNPYAGQLWIDTSSGAGILKKYNGSSWDTETDLDSIKKDGSVEFTGNQSMGGKRLTNVGAPTTNGDAIRTTTKITEANLESAVDLKHTAGGETQGGDVSGTVGNASVVKIKGKEVDDTDIGDGKVLVYNGEKYVFEGKLENWTDAPGNPAYSGSDNFKVDGDLRTIYYVGRCIRYKDTAGGDTWQYTIIPNNYYNAENDKTFVYVADSGLDEGLNSFQLANFSAGQIEFSISGNFSVMTGITHFSSGGEAGKIVNIQAYCLVSPTGADAIFDVNYSTDLGTWTTLFTTQSHRPVIYKDSKWSDYRIVPDVVDFLGTWYFRCDCDQIGSTVAGADGVIKIFYIPKNKIE